MGIGVPEDETLSASPKEHSQARDLSKAAPTPLSRHVPAIPGYRMEQRLGQGTFGEVWSAIQVRTGQRLAVKIFTHPQGLDWRYFRREVRRLSRVADHPYVVTLLDAELTYNPPFFTMPQLAGSLAEQVEGERPDPEQVLIWFEQTSRALDYAHGKGVFHCDLKPSNVLIDREGQARLADFGQALLPGEVGNALGTLWYMAPEQIGWEPGANLPEPDARWDIYGLGATVYMALTGRAPRYSPGSHTELRQLRESGPRLEAYRRILSENPLVPIRTLNPLVDADFAAIIESCLAVDPQRRTGSVQAILTDLERRRKKLPLLCRRPWPPGYRFSRFVRRNLAAVVAGTLCTVVLVVAGNQVIRARDTADLTSLSSHRLRSLEAHREGLEATALAWLGQAVEQRPGDPDLYLAATRPSFVLDQVFDHRERVNSVTFDASGAWILSGSEDDTAALWRRGQAEPVRVLAHPAPVLGGLFLPGGLRAITACRDGRARVWNLSRGSLALPAMNHGTSFSGMSIDEAGKLLLTSSEQGSARLWELENGAARGPEFRHLPGKVPALLSSDGRRVVTRVLPDALQVWSTDGRPVGSPVSLADEVTALARDGSGLVAAGCADGSVTLVDTVNGSPTTLRLRDDASLASLEFHPTEHLLAAGTRRGTAIIWNVREGRPLLEVAAGSSPTSVDFEDRRLITRTADGTVRCWTLDGRSEGIEAGPGALPPAVHDQVVAVATGATVRLFVKPAPAVERAGLGLSAPLLDGAIDSRSRRVGGLTSTGLAGLWDADTLASLGEALLPGSFNTGLVQLSPHGALWLAGGRLHLERPPLSARVAARSADQVAPDVLALSLEERLELWQLPGLEPIRAWDLGGASPTALASDGRRLVVGTRDGTVRWWDLTSGEPGPAVQAHTGEVTCLDVRPEGLLLSGSRDGSVAVIGPDGGQRYRPLPTGAPVTCVAFDPASGRVAAGCLDGTAQLWEALSGFPVLPPRSHSAPVLAVALEGDSLVCLTGAGEVARWSLAVDDDLPADLLVRLDEVWTGMTGVPPAPLQPMSGSEWRGRRSEVLRDLTAHLESCDAPQACQRLLRLTGPEATL